jgi:DNA-binding transcriptional LysR family regulator
VCLSFVSEGDEEIAPLRDGRIDMDLGRNTDLAPELSRLDLYQETVVGLLAPDNPLAGQNMTLERLATLPHVSVSRRGEPRGPLDDVLARAGLSRRVVVVVPSFAAAVLVVLSTEATCLLPRSMINELAQTTGALAYEVPTELGVAPVSLVWHTRFDSDPAHRWLRQVFSEVAGRFRAKTDAAKTAE